MGTWGTLTFANYADATSGETLNGTLQLEVYQTAGDTIFNGPVTWNANFAGLLDVRGNIQYSGAASATVTYDFLATVTGASAVLSGTASLASIYYDVSTGQQTSAPVPTVTFSPASRYSYRAQSPDPDFVMTSSGTTAIYYTTDWSMPTTSSTHGSSPLTIAAQIGYGALPYNPIVIAFAANGSATSRISFIVYPSTAS